MLAVKQNFDKIRFKQNRFLINHGFINIQGVPIKSAATLKQHYSITKTLAENVKTVLELWGIGL